MSTATPIPPALAPTRLLPRDIVGQGLVGLRSKRMRTLLTAVGITSGIAAMVSVVGISASSRATTCSARSPSCRCRPPT